MRRLDEESTLGSSPAAWVRRKGGEFFFWVAVGGFWGVLLWFGGGFWGWVWVFFLDEYVCYVCFSCQFGEAGHFKFCFSLDWSCKTNSEDQRDQSTASHPTPHRVLQTDRVLAFSWLNASKTLKLLEIKAALHQSNLQEVGETKLCSPENGPRLYVFGIFLEEKKPTRDARIQEGQHEGNNGGSTTQW